MPLEFVHGWQHARPQYVQRYGNYQAFLRAFSENAIRRALFDARGHYRDRWIQRFLDIANDPFSRQDIMVEQGAHQAEDVRGGGFRLHFTGRDPDGVAFHFYVIQRNNATLRVDEITYMDGGRLRRARYA